jgi:hypothetical protein
LTNVNKIRHHCKYQRRFAPTVIHIVGTVHSHRRNTHRTKEFLKLALEENPSLATLVVAFIPAEKILIDRHKFYAKIFSDIRETNAWRRTQLMEKSGVEALQAGSYRFQAEGYGFSGP